MAKRLDFLDVAKGIGIILVLMGHSSGFLFGGHYITAFYMAMFFLVAGYVYHPSGRGYKEKAGKRLKRILVPYFGYNALLFGYYLAKNLVAGDFDLEEMLTAIAGIFYSRNYFWVGLDENIYFFKLLNDPVWFLTAMCTASLIFYAVVDKCLGNWKACGYICSILLLAAAALDFSAVLLPWSLDSAPLFAFFMIVGALLGREELFQKKYTAAQWLFMAVAFGLSILLRAWNGKTNLSVRVYGNIPVLNVFLVAVIGVIGSVAFVWISKALCRVKLLESLLAFVGRNTLVIMALHMAVFQLEDKAAGLLLGEAVSRPVVYGCCCVMKIVGALLLCIGFSYGVDAVKKLLAKGFSRTHPEKIN